MSDADYFILYSTLYRFYEPQGGGIFLDGRPASSFSLGEWSRAVAMVGQEPVLFSGTIGENIAYGKWGKASQEVSKGWIDNQAENRQGIAFDLEWI